MGVRKVGRWVAVITGILGTGKDINDERKWGAVMAAIDNLEAAVALNTANVELVLAEVKELRANQVDAARVQAAADEVAAAAAALAEAVK